jgi:hypothetical protein
MSVVDLHITHTIANGIKYYADNENAFNELFYDIGANLKAAYHDKLLALDIKYDVAFRKKHDKFPLITVSVEEKSSDAIQPLGNRGIQSNLSLLVNQVCDINIYVDDLDSIRILHRLIQASMLIFKKNFLAIGYLNIQFQKSTNLEVEDELITSGVDIYARSLTFTAQKQINAKPPVVVWDGPWELNPNIIES